MKMTLYKTLDMIEHGETPEAYRKRINRIRRLSIDSYGSVHEYSRKIVKTRIYQN